MSEQSKEVTDALFQQKVLDYIKQDVKDKEEIKADIKSAREEINSAKINVAVLQTKSGIFGAVAGAVVAGLVEWLAGWFHAK